MVNISVITLIKGHRVVENLLNKLSMIDLPPSTEILVIDAMPGSADDIKEKHPEVKWIYYHTEKKYTIPEQRNLGINRAKGKIIVFIDADCLPEKMWLINLIRPISEGKESFTAGKIKSLNKFPLRWSKGPHSRKNKEYVNFAPTMNFAMSREGVDIVGLYDTTFEFGGEDTDYSWRIRKNNLRIRFVKSAVIAHDWGSFKRNLFRNFVYGKAYYYLLKKYKQTVPDKFDVCVSAGYVIYLIGLPVLLFFPYYLLLLLIPLIKGLIDGGSIAYAIENTLFNFINGLGIIAGMLKNIYYYLSGASA